MIATNELAYPVIIFCKNNIIEIAIDEDSLSTATDRDLKIGWLNNFIIVDSNSRAAKIKKVKYVSGKGKFWGYTISLSRIVKVDLTLGEPFDMSFEEAKKRVLKWMRIEKNSIADVDYWWKEMHKVEETQTMKEMIKVLIPHYDRQKFFERLRRL